jgi:hypothetical protein
MAGAIGVAFPPKGIVLEEQLRRHEVERCYIYRVDDDKSRVQWGLSNGHDFMDSHGEGTLSGATTSTAGLARIMWIIAKDRQRIAVVTASKTCA